MDASVDWSISPEVEQLVTAVTECKRRLVNGCKQKHEARVKVLSCDAYCSEKVVELFKLSDAFSTAADVAEVDDPMSRVAKRTTELVGDFGAFKLHKIGVFDDNIVRLIAVFNVEGEKFDQTWFGSVRLTSS